MKYSKIQNISICLTYSCNQNCIFCFIPKIKESRLELNTKAFKKVIDKLKDSNILALSFLGGEPFCREDFEEIYAHAKKRGFLISLYTNATLLTPPKIKFLYRYPPHTIEIPLYGLKPETHDKITQKPGSFEKTLKNIITLKEKGFNLKIKTKILRLNKEEIPHLEEFVQEKLRLPFYIHYLTYHWNSRIQDLRIPPEELAEFLMQRKNDFQKAKNKAKHRRLDPPLFKCQAGKRIFSLNPYGEVSPCLLVNSPRYSLLENDWQIIQHKLNNHVKKSTIPKEHPCRSCGLFFLCGQCPGKAELECNDQQTVVEYLCKFGRYLYSYLKKEVEYETEDGEEKRKKENL